jgi:putative component of toxin-antitoxin plasmid stabilization module
MMSETMNAPQTNVFDFNNGKTLALASLDAYTSAEQFPFYNARTDTLAHIIETECDIIIAFRGTTQNVKDWLADLRVEFTEVRFSGKSFRVHTGFYDDVQSVWDAVLEVARHAKACGKRLWVTGHSKGGAEAILCAWFFAKMAGIVADGIYTFGQPRVGNRAFRRDYDALLGDRTFRVIHSADIVPHVPLPPIFRHAAHYVFFDDDKQWELDGSPLWRMWQEAVACWHWMWKFKLAALEDHHCQLYAELFASA